MDMYKYTPRLNNKSVLLLTFLNFPNGSNPKIRLTASRPMFQFFRYEGFISLALAFPFSLLFLLLFFPCFPARTLTVPSTELTVAARNETWRDFARFLDASRGSNVTGMAQLKKYFQRFGYLDPVPKSELTDSFDDRFESAVVAYQRNLGLSITGVLDSDTVAAIISPRCGVSDHAGAVHATRRYAYFYGEPRWAKSPPITLTFAFSPDNTIDYIPEPDLKAAFERAFSRWSAVIPVNFTEAEEYWTADIKIGFYSGDHGDGEPFDGVLGILAHAFSPQNGRFHLDAAETWAVDFGRQKSKAAVDLESVATHEIGHVLGLAHSTVKEAIMYPSLSPRSKKVDLKLDDVEGIQALYGKNPNFKFSSLIESDTSSSWAVRLPIGCSLSLWPILALVLPFVS